MKIIIFEVKEELNFSLTIEYGKEAGLLHLIGWQKYLLIIFDSRELTGLKQQNLYISGSRKLEMFV